MYDPAIRAIARRIVVMTPQEGRRLLALSRSLREVRSELSVGDAKMYVQQAVHELTGTYFGVAPATNVLTGPHHGLASFYRDSEEVCSPVRMPHANEGLKYDEVLKHFFEVLPSLNDIELISQLLGNYLVFASAHLPNGGDSTGNLLAHDPDYRHSFIERTHVRWLKERTERTY